MIPNRESRSNGVYGRSRVHDLMDPQSSQNLDFSWFFDGTTRPGWKDGRLEENRSFICFMDRIDRQWSLQNAGNIVHPVHPVHPVQRYLTTPTYYSSSSIRSIGSCLIQKCSTRKLEYPLYTWEF